VGSHSVTTASSSVAYGQTASNHLAVCGAQAATCCNCKLLEGKKPHPNNYRGCRHAEELQKKKTQRTPNTTTGKVFSSKLNHAQCLLRGSTAHQQDPQARQVPVVDPVAGMQSRKPAPGQQQQTSGQSVRAQNVNNQPLDNMLRVVTVVQQIMTKFNGAVSEEEKIVSITKILLNLMKHNGH
jgi:hypothetical protein